MGLRELIVQNFFCILETGGPGKHRRCREAQDAAGTAGCATDRGFVGIRSMLESAWNLEVPQPHDALLEQQAAQQAGSKGRTRVSGKQGPATQSAARTGGRASVGILWRSLLHQVPVMLSDMTLVVTDLPQWVQKLQGNQPQSAGRLRGEDAGGRPGTQQAHAPASC